MPRRRFSIDRQIEDALAGWVADGLVTATDWDGSPLLFTPLPSGPGVTFDKGSVERVLRFFLLLRQLLGRWAGQPFVLLDWQVRWLIAPVFGIKNAAGLRVIRTVWFEIPRKNGKSTLCSGIALYLFAADREPGAQVYAAAGDKPQAGIVFKAARDMAEGSTDLARWLGRGIRRGLLEHPRTGSIFRALSSDGSRQHGLNVHGAVVDEVHVHKNPDLIDALETGVGSREQPLIVFITTSDDGTDGSVYATKREYIEGVCSGVIVDPSTYGVVFGADTTAEGFDPFSDDTIVAANPGAGVTVLMDYLQGKAQEASQSPSQLNRYLRLHLNVRTRQTVRWLPLDRWDASAGMVDPDVDFQGLSAYVGLDLSATTDFTAAVFVAHDPPGYVVWPLLWIPEERVDELERRTAMPLRRWVAEGWLRATEGNVVDYAQVRADIALERDRLGCTVVEVGYDPWNAAETVQEMQNDGYTMVPLRQGYATLTAPTKEVERLVMGSTPEAPMLRHGGHPVLRWMADCVEVTQDASGNIKPAKPDRRKSTKRIDGIAGLVNAMARAMLRQQAKVHRAGGF